MPVRQNRVCHIVHVVADTLHINGKLQENRARFGRAFSLVYARQMGSLHYVVHAVGFLLLPFDVGHVMQVAVAENVSHVFIKFRSEERRVGKECRL